MRPVPKSKTRKRSTRRPYVPDDRPVRKPRSSPRWYGYVVLGLILVGVFLIVLNYMGLLPPGETVQGWLWAGLGFIAAGFIAATRWR